MVLRVQRIGLLTGLYDFGRDGASLPDAEAIQGTGQVVQTIMAGVMLIVAAVWRRAPRAGPWHQVGVPVHLVGALA